MNIDLTDREIELLMDCIGTNIETVKRRHDPADPMITELIEELFELETDLREALHRRDDEWSGPEDPDLHMDPADFAAKHDTASSRAADRRTFKMRHRDSRLTKTRDVWDANDPKNW